MSETAGSMGFVSFRGNPSNSFAPTKKNTLLDDLSDAYEKRRMAKQEMRKKELEAKGENSELNTMEAMELTGYKIEDALEKMAFLTKPRVCYMA